MRVDEEKRKYFNNGGQSWMKSYDSWKKEFSLCDCQTCLSINDCPASRKTIRFPYDSGGEGQCLRLAQAEGNYAFRNVDGRVIVIPDEIVSHIIADVLAKLPGE